MRAAEVHGAHAKLGDLVETPTHRMARVMDIRGDGRRLCQYLHGEPGEVVLPPSLLRTLVSVPVTGFRDRPRPSEPAPVMRYRGRA